MKMRHFWRWPVLCSVLFGLAAAGTAAGIQTASTAPGAAQSAEPATRLAYDARLHGRIAAIRAGLVAAREAQHRPAALRALAVKVEGEASRIVEESQAATPASAALETIVAGLYSGADDLRHASKSVRSAGLRRLDGALQEYRRRFEQPYETVS